ncbi:MAG: hypothetical protein ACJASQ_001288 [Crocinitomicaceae bacterium]|jgi:hypothetical protein
MKKLLSLMTFCGLFAGTSIAQVNPSFAPDTPIWGTVENTGIAIAPFYQWQAVVYDDPSGAYFIQWLDAGTGALLDFDTQPGSNPDVAYYANADAVVVAYENGGGIFVDDYYLTTVTPTNYNLNMNNPVSSGINPNVDINSLGQGILTWEDGGGVFMCSFTIGTFTAGPIVGVAGGSMPDIALSDNGQDIFLTYEQGGQLVMETYDYPTLTFGGLTPTSAPVIVPTSGGGFQWPRVQANRNSLFGGAPEYYTVVAQDDMGGIYDVWAFFYVAPGAMVGNSLVNNGVNFCSPSLPRPVVAYDRDEVHVAWAQDYACAGIPPGIPLEQDVLMVQYDYFGAYAPGSTTPGPVMFQEVNNFNLDFTFSATSLNTEYDGNYLITPTNYCEGIVFNNPGDFFWKKRNATMPFFKTGDASTYAVSIVKGIGSDVIEVEVQSTIDSEVSLSDVKMEFALYDAMGRLIDVPTVTESGTSYYIDASQLENGIYLLHYEINGIAEAARIPHFKN